ncbi:hypothetical protein SAMN05428642_103367 [Flaviramulus basaltis]|uniref:RiboL-PSP-HEPN domain-containing protein n=1 Tax=Flaviramulus basaltis TaxID=369401 RepID=A0A1K2IMZ9_9FLAO|nr:HEPN domain-containing protein [Flaviramulus basaltis]SFZ93845.1 hypothetical protein SAMN05428642_103367 [Flaviramulus basaltis]
MANSKRYIRLVSRINSLETNLLPIVKISGNYTKKESDLIRSYVLLVHAEIESYFEDVALQKIEKAFDDWIIGRKKSNCLLAVMSFCADEINWDRIQKVDKLKFDFRVNKVVRHFINKLGSNHGIKSEHLYKMLLPVGVEESDLDNAWLSTMDSFGAQRGSIAHSTISAQNQIDLVTQRNNINLNILPPISDLDLLIKSLK